MAITNSDGSIILSTKIDQKGITRGLGDIQSKAKKAFFAIGAIATTSTAVITKMAVSAYADYEQLVGGVETLFKGSADKVKAYASDAFFTAGVSANEYMRQVTSFSASLIRSTAGDTDKAADIANMALIDISDNVNKMGSSMESVTLAYQGFAKQQYMLLDNLKLGYGGTKTEMERLLRDAEALTGVKYDINNLADVYSAIHAIQEELGITGTTAKEAEKTITGSANMMKAAWQNVLSAIAGGGDLDRAINNLVYSIQKYFENIAPVVEKALHGIATLIAKIAPQLVEKIAKSLIKSIPMLLVAIYDMIVALAKGIYESIKALFTDTAKEIAGAQIDKINETAESQEKVTEEVKKTNKELKKTLASFDEISILAEKNEDDISEQLVDGTRIKSSSIGQVNDDVEKTVTETLDNISSKIKDALIVIGVILLLFGNIPFGLGFIITGAIAYGVTDQKTNEFDIKKVSNFLNEIDKYIAPALLTIGLILLILGHVPFGVGFIVVGAITYGVKEIKSSGEYDETSIKTKLAIIGEAVSLSLTAIGMILLMLGNFAWGVGFIIAGASLLKVSEGQLGKEEITTKLKAFFTENKDIIEKIAFGMFLCGVLLTFGGAFGVGLGLMAGSAGLIYASAELSSSDVVSELKKFFQENVKLILGIALGLLIIGILVCFIPGMLGFGLSMVALGIGLVFIEQKLAPEQITQIIADIGRKVAPYLITSGAILMALGLLLICTGAGVGVGLALVAAGGALLYGGLELDNSKLAMTVADAKEMLDRGEELWVVDPETNELNVIHSSSELFDSYVHEPKGSKEDFQLMDSLVRDEIKIDSAYQEAQRMMAEQDKNNIGYVGGTFVGANVTLNVDGEELARTNNRTSNEYNLIQGEAIIR